MKAVEAEFDRGGGLIRCLRQIDFSDWVDVH